MNSEEQETVELFMNRLNLAREEATAIAISGITSIEEVAYIPVEELLEIGSIESERLLQIREYARRLLLPL